MLFTDNLLKNIRHCNEKVELHSNEKTLYIRPIKSKYVLYTIRKLTSY